MLRGVNVNHGGRSVSLTAPNGVAHKILLTNLFKSTPGVEAAVWEAHGTGTSLGDPIEVALFSIRLLEKEKSQQKVLFAFTRRVQKGNNSRDWKDATKGGQYHK